MRWGGKDRMRRMGISIWSRVNQAVVDIARVIESWVSPNDVGGYSGLILNTKRESQSCIPTLIAIQYSDSTGQSCRDSLLKKF